MFGGGDEQRDRIDGHQFYESTCNFIEAASSVGLRVMGSGSSLEVLKVLLIRGEGIILKHSEQLWLSRDPGNQVQPCSLQLISDKLLVSGIGNVQKFNFPLNFKGVPN